jgi:hypothetical protein
VTVERTYYLRPKVKSLKSTESGWKR